MNTTKIVPSSKDAFTGVSFLPMNKERKAEGGLRTKSYLKKSYEDKPLISIITVVYNGEKYLEETILSVINQTYDNIEYIIIDGGSTDGTLDIIRKYEDKIDYWVSEKDRGIYDAMNKGVNLATGNWINFMNAGDAFFDNNIIKALSFDKQYDYIYGNHALKNESTDQQLSINVNNYLEKRKIPFCHQSLFAKREWLKKYPFDLNYKIAGDYDQYLKAKHHGATSLHVSTVIAIFLEGGMSALSGKKIIHEYYDITKKYYPLHALAMKTYRILKYYLKRKKA